MADTKTVEEPGLGAIIMIDYGYEHGGALRSLMYVHTAAGWSIHPDGRHPVTWKWLTDLKRKNIELRTENRFSDVLHGYRVTVLAYSPTDLLETIMEESCG